MQKIISSLALVTVLLLVAFKSPVSITVTGKVTDADGNPIPFCSVYEKGTSRGTQTDATGAFSINVKEKAILVISMVGYTKTEVAVGKKTFITVTLEKSTAYLQEVVVVGYGTTKKSMRTSGSVQSISGEQLNATPPANINNALSGKVSGIRIRGMASITPNSNNQNTDAYDFNREGYDNIEENIFHKVKDNPLSTFSIDVDAAAYSNMRRFINAGQLPPAGAVRIEEMINYFKYEYPQPEGNAPFSVNTEVATCPWNANHKLALIGLQGKIIPEENLPPSNLVFLIDVSGSMSDPDKLPLVQQSLKLLTERLRSIDKVSLCVYAGNAGLVLPATPGVEKQKIKDAIDALESGGSTAGGYGIQLAYKTAKENFIKGGNNRVILCTDGDFNVGITSDDALENLIESERKSGVFLTVLGFGTGNYQDAKMQKLADKGNGNHAYIDQLSEAKKVFVNEFGGTLFTIAKDVKLQVEFNPLAVQGYRLIGYENRMLNKEDFNDDKKDAGEMGSGHTVTALYELIPVGEKSAFLKATDTLKYQAPAEILGKSVFAGELMTVKLRYKKPDGDVSRLMEVPVKNEYVSLVKASGNLRFAASVAQFGMLLRNSAYREQASFKSVLTLSKSAADNDAQGYRKEFIELVIKAKKLVNKKESEEVEEEDAVSLNEY